MVSTLNGTANNSEGSTPGMGRKVMQNNYINNKNHRDQG